MDYRKPRMLEKSIEVSARSRPIKVAYLVPFEVTVRAHSILGTS